MKVSRHDVLKDCYEFYDRVFIESHTFYLTAVPMLTVHEWLLNVRTHAIWLYDPF